MAFSVCSCLGLWPFRVVFKWSFRFVGLWPFRFVLWSFRFAGLWPFRFVIIFVCGCFSCGHFSLWLLWPLTCVGRISWKGVFFIFKHWTEIVKSGAISGWNDELQILKQIITYIIYCSTTEMKKYFHGMSLKSSYSYIILQWQFSIMIGNAL